MAGKNTPEQMGAHAFDDGLDSDSNPYSHGHSSRRRWFDGYYSRRVDLLVSKVLKSLGLSNDK
jgi:hypothetical protein